MLISSKIAAVSRYRACQNAFYSGGYHCFAYTLRQGQSATCAFEADKPGPASWQAN